MKLSKGLLLLVVMGSFLPLACSKETKEKKEDSPKDKKTATQEAAEPAEKPRVTLRERFHPGKYRAVMDMSGEQTVKFRGQEQKQLVSSLMEMEMDVSQPDEAGEKEIAISFTRARMKAGPMALDTDAPEEEEYGPMAAAQRTFRKLLKLKMLLTASADDKKVTFKGFDEASQRQIADDPQLEMMADQMVKGASIEGMLAVNKLFPDDPVGVGAVWHPSFKQPLGTFGEAMVKAECELKELKDTAAGKMAVIEYSGDAKKTGTTDEGGMGPSGMRLVELDMDQKGRVNFNVDKGMAENVTVKQKGKMRLEMTGPMGEKVTTGIDQEIKVELTVKPL
ncbi:MAG: hypothetical protein ACYTF6_03865 [Planctomycetota bacterium]|jgi:hypothetical protein